MLMQPVRIADGAGGRMKKTKIKRCPYCKHPKPWVVRIHPLRGIFTKYYIECRACHYCGKTKVGKKRAIRSWNAWYEYGVENVMKGERYGN